MVFSRVANAVVAKVRVVMTTHDSPKLADRWFPPGFRR
jgi:hypothetical protein